MRLIKISNLRKSKIFWVQQNLYKLKFKVKGLKNK